MSAPVGIVFSPDQSRAAFSLFHPKGNIVTAAMVDALRTGLEVDDLMRTADAAEGIAAFLEKRSPRWRDR